MKPNTPARPAFTEEQKKEQMMRLYLQKKASIAEGVLFNMVQGMGVSLCYEKDNHPESKMADNLVRLADEISTEFMKVVHKAELIEDKTEE